MPAAGTRYSSAIFLSGPPETFMYDCGFTSTTLRPARLTSHTAAPGLVFQ